MKQSEALLSEAKAINASLNRSKEHLQVSVLQSDTAAQILDSDGSVLAEALNDHKVELRATLASTKKRLERIKTAEKWEQTMMMISLSIFASVVVFIFLSRFRVFVNIQYLLFGNGCSNSYESHEEL